MNILAEMTPLKRLCNMACNNSVTLIMNKILISTEGPSSFFGTNLFMGKQSN